MTAILADTPWVVDPQQTAPPEPVEGAPSPDAIVLPPPGKEVTETEGGMLDPRTISPGPDVLQPDLEPRAPESGTDLHFAIAADPPAQPAPPQRPQENVPPRPGKPVEEPMAPTPGPPTSPPPEPPAPPTWG